MSEPIAIIEFDYWGCQCGGSSDCRERPAVTVRNWSCPESIYLCPAHAEQLLDELSALRGPASTTNRLLNAIASAEALLERGAARGPIMLIQNWEIRGRG